MGWTSLETLWAVEPVDHVIWSRAELDRQLGADAHDTANRSKQKAHRITQVDERFICRQIRAGLSIKDIAASVGFSERTVLRIGRKNGLGRIRGNRG